LFVEIKNYTQDARYMHKNTVTKVYTFLSCIIMNFRAPYWKVLVLMNTQKFFMLSLLKVWNWK